MPCAVDARMLVLGSGSTLARSRSCLATDAARLHLAHIDPPASSLFRLDPARTGVIAISKSAPRNLQVKCCRSARCRAAVAAATAGGPPMVAISEPGAPPARHRRLSRLSCLDHAPDLGGGFLFGNRHAAGLGRRRRRCRGARRGRRPRSRPVAAGCQQPPGVGAAINAALAAEGFDQRS